MGIEKTYHMEERVRALVRQHGLLRGGERVVVAVSGGADSVALLHLLWRWREELGLWLYVAHLNHRLRPEAEQEAEFVRSLARDLGLPVTVGSADVRRAVRAGESLEDVARRIRHGFLLSVADEVGADKVALGHQADDQAETVLLHLLRGSGASGLSGIPWKRDRFIRPLLGVTRAEIEEYCRRHGLSYIRDPSNADPTFLRNRIRQELIPLLKRDYNPQIVEILGQTADILSEEDGYLEAQLDKYWPDLAAVEEPDRVALRASVLASLPLCLRRRALRRAHFALVGRENHLLSYRHVEQVLEVVLARPGREAHLPQRVVVVHRNGLLVFRRAGEASGPEEVRWPVCRRLAVPGRTEFGGWVIEAKVYPAGEARPVLESSQETECDLDRLPLPIFLRFWQPGDFFWPLGLSGRKKLQDFFVDAKVPRERRREIPLVVCREGIVWVVGYRLDERWRVRPETRQILRLTVRQKLF